MIHIQTEIFLNKVKAAVRQGACETVEECTEKRESRMVTLGIWLGQRLSGN